MKNESPVEFGSKIDESLHTDAKKGFAHIMLHITQCILFCTSPYLIVHVETMVGNNKALETCHVCVWALPGKQERMRLYMTQLKAADRWQRTQFRVFDGEKIAVQDGCRFGALRAYFGTSFLGREPFSMLPQPDLLHVGLARANQRVAYEDRKNGTFTQLRSRVAKKTFKGFAFLLGIQFFKKCDGAYNRKPGAVNQCISNYPPLESLVGGAANQCSPPGGILIHVT